MKKTILITMSKNYQKVELSLEMELGVSGNAYEVEQAIKTNLIKEANDMLTEVLASVDSIDLPSKATTSNIVEPRYSPTLSQPTTEVRTHNEGRVYNAGEKTLSEKQIFQLKKHNVYVEGMSYEAGKEALDKLFGGNKNNGNNNFNNKYSR